MDYSGSTLLLVLVFPTVVDLADLMVVVVLGFEVVVREYVGARTLSWSGCNTSATLHDLFTLNRCPDTHRHSTIYSPCTHFHFRTQNPSFTRNCLRIEVWISLETPRNIIPVG